MHSLKILFYMLVGWKFVWSTDVLTPTLTPSLATTYIGGEVQFICIKPNTSMEIAWNPSSFTNTSHSNTGNENISKFLSLVPSVSFNNTLVSCIGRLPNEPSKLYHSNPGKIVLQGPLSKVNPTIAILNPCTVQIFWDPPFSLEGVPILGYNVNITDWDRKIETHFSTSNTYIQIYFGYDYTVSIAGVNGAGEGNISVIDINSLANERFNMHVYNITISRNGSTWNINATVNSEVVCDNNAINSKVFFNFCLRSINEPCFNTSDVSQTISSGNRTLLFTSTLLLENQHYIYTVIHKIGKLLFSSNENTISTFDVQSIEYRDVLDGSVCLTIDYVIGSVATGCYIKLIFGQDLLTDFTIDGYSGCSPNPIVTDGNTKTCSLEGFDEVNDVIENENGPAVKFDITISGESIASSSVVSVQTTTPATNNNIVVKAVIPTVTVLLVLIVEVLILAIFASWIVKKLKRRKHQVINVNIE